MRAGAQRRTQSCCVCCPHPQENQTKPEGQIHFFPIIFNGRQLYEVMSERCGPSATTPLAPPKN